MIDAPILIARAKLLKQLRAFFDARDFVEVQPPCLSRDCVIDAYIDPLEIEAAQFGIAETRLDDRFYLQTSPESAMKRMLSGGAPSIYSIGPVFRRGERGDLHNPEFTMLEWYEVGGDLESGIKLLSELAIETLAVPNVAVCRYDELFLQYLGIHPRQASIAELAKLASQVDPQLAESIADDRDALLDLLLSRQIQPKMRSDPPRIVTHYPISQAALAKVSEDDPECAARFELFVGGVEIANGYDELLDADVLIARYNESNRKRAKNNRAMHSVETTLIQAMRSGLPSCAGVALGVDRLFMQQIGCTRIDQVIAFPIEEA